MAPARVVDWLVDYEAVAHELKPFDESGIWDPGMDPFPPSRAEAVRIAQASGEALGVKVLSPGAQRRLQPVVDKFFYSLAANNFETQRLGLWWANRMLASPRPLEEKLTLFWHGHFATAANKVRDYRMMLRQNVMLRERASGRLRDLLVSILKDPAMLVFLDNGENVKEHPNENFGRELLELFTMGVGNYSERDVREAARAFTGWTNDVLEFKFDATTHDFGEKTFLGQKGTLQRRRRHRRDPETAGHRRVRCREDLPVLRARRCVQRRRVRTSGGRSARAATRSSRCSNGSSSRRTSIARSRTRTQIKSPVHLVISTYKKMGLTEVPTIPDFGRMTCGIGTVPLQSAERCGVGRRAHVDYPGHLAAARQHVPRRAGARTSAPSVHLTGRCRPPMQRVGQRLAQGMDITTATLEGDAESNMMVERDEDYNTRYSGYKATLLAFERVKVIPRRTASVDLAAMIEAAGATTPEQVVDHFIHRFLRVPPGEKDRAAIVNYLRNKVGGSDMSGGGDREAVLREVLYLVLSTPEYQVG